MDSSNYRGYGDVFQDFGAFLEHAILNSGADRFARAHFRSCGYSHEEDVDALEEQPQEASWTDWWEALPEGEE